MSNYVNNNMFLCKQLKKGDSFNHKGMFTNYKHELTARCKQITQILYFNYDDF